MQEEIEKRSAVQDYLNDLKYYPSVYQASIIRDEIENNGRKTIDAALNHYIGTDEDSNGDWRFVDREFNTESRTKAFVQIRSTFYTGIEKSLKEFGHEGVFNSDGTLARLLTKDAAVTIARDVPLSSILMDKEGFKAAMEDKHVVLEVSKTSISIEYASDSLKSDKEVLLEALKWTPYALEYASQELKGNKDVVLAAGRSDANYAMRHASDELKNDKDFILKAIGYNVRAFESASKEIKELCKDKDPFETLKKAINYDNLKKRLAPTSVEQPKQKLKI